MINMKLPIAEKYSMLIKHLKRCHRDFLIPKESDRLNEDLRAFISDTTAEINGIDEIDTSQAGTKPLLAIPETWTFIELSENAYALLIYREYLGVIALHQTQYKNDYIAFCKEQKILNTALKEGNPFILHEHLIHIHNLVTHHKTAEQHPDIEISTLEFYQCLLLQAKEQITQMDSETFGSFRLYLKVLADYSLSHATLEANQDDIDFHRTLLESTIRDTYISMTVCKLFMTQSQAKRITEDDSAAKTLEPTEDQRKLNFYLSGKGLFDRTPFCSIEALEKQLLSLSILPSSTLMFSYDRAKEQFLALNQNILEPVIDEPQKRATQNLFQSKLTQ